MSEACKNIMSQLVDARKYVYVFMKIYISMISSQGQRGKAVAVMRNTAKKKNESIMAAAIISYLERLEDVTEHFTDRGFAPLRPSK